MQRSSGADETFEPSGIGEDLVKEEGSDDKDDESDQLEEAEGFPANSKREGPDANSATGINDRAGGCRDGLGDRKSTEIEEGNTDCNRY
ncbi:hypothetical protein PtB15_5B497 [Puccinia triticina]|nr:hypothetical protein PtB15_5B497 [Puccinia triticina]